MNKNTLAVGDDAPQIEGLSQNANEEIILLFMGRVGRMNAKGKSRGLVDAKKQDYPSEVKIYLIWDDSEEEVQTFKSTVPGLVELSNVFDIYDLDQSIQTNYKSVLYKGISDADDESTATGTGNDEKLGFPDYLIKNGKIIWTQENERFYKLSLILRGWRP